MNILITGVSGYVGSRLAPRMLRDGHLVRGMSRNPPDGDSEIPIVAADAVSGVGLDRALRGIDVAYFLIHSMEPATGNGSFGAREQAAAENFAAAARAAGVRRIIYLGGLIPHAGPASAHLASRLAVERILLDASPCSVAFRASIVIGARSRSFRLLVHLIERMPVLTLPAWRGFRTRPIDARDVTEMLAAAATAKLPRRSLDVGGPDLLSYGEMIARIADLLLLRRPSVGLAVSATPLAARFAAAIAGEDPELVLPLMESLDGDLLPADDHAERLLDVQLHSFDSAVEHALREWEEREPLAAR